ncbi:hypothetical protein C2U68_02170 [Methylomonas koyamae]|nr:hypothetical protein C2U68_02170 [Methylomonas koyamae]
METSGPFLCLAFFQLPSDVLVAALGATFSDNRLLAAEDFFPAAFAAVKQAANLLLLKNISKR